MYFFLFSFWLLFHSSHTTHSSHTASIPLAPYSLQLKNVLITTDDGGSNWTDITGNLPGDAFPMSLWVDQSEYLLGTATGLYKGNPGIPSTKWNQEMMMPKEVMFFTQGSMGPYAVSRWKGIFQRQSGTGLWVNVSEPMKNKPFFSMMESSDGNLIAGCETGLYKSDDHGQSWKSVYDKGGINYIMESNHVLIACSLRGLLRSADGGNHWDLVYPGTTTVFRSRLVKEGIVALVEGQDFGGIRAPNEVLLSKDNGLTWKPMFASLPVGFKDIYDLVQVGDVYFACADYGIFRSTDQGATWEVTVSMPQDKPGIFKLFTEGQTLFALLAAGC